MLDKSLFEPYKSNMAKAKLVGQKWSYKIMLYLSGRNKMYANKTKAFVKVKEYVWHLNKDYVGGATC